MTFATWGSPGCTMQPGDHTVQPPGCTGGSGGDGCGDGSAGGDECNGGGCTVGSGRCSGGGLKFHQSVRCKFHQRV
jgi:hypothetical protein